MVYLESIRESIVFIEDNIKKSLTIHDVAAHVNYSTYHFSRIFSCYTGISLGSYIKLRRLNIATTKLLSSKMPFLEISSFVGYNSYEAFSREIKAKFGSSPFYLRKEATFYYLMSCSLFDEVLLEHITNKFVKSPTEVTLPDFKLVGRLVATKLKNNNLPQFWDCLKNKMKSQLKVAIDEVDSFSICKSSSAILKRDGDSTFFSFLGYKKKDCLEMYSKELELEVVAGGKYILFEHKDTYHSLELSYRYIWHIWMHTSSINYDASRQSFEQHTKNKSLILIYIPIK